MVFKTTLLRQKEIKLSLKTLSFLRRKEIKEKLHYVLLRYNPDYPVFNVTKVINKINRHHKNAI